MKIHRLCFMVFLSFSMLISGCGRDEGKSQEENTEVSRNLEKENFSNSGGDFDMGKLNLELPKQLEPYRTIFEESIKPYVKIKATKGKTLPWESKFGGYPYIQKGFDYPKNADGEPMYLLAQINFEEVPYIDPFPKKGILQFYITADDINYLYGLDLDNPTSQEHFRVIYIPEVIKDEGKIITDFSFLPEPEEHTLPVNGEFALNFTKGYQPVTAEDFQFEKIFGKDAYELGKSVFDNEDDMDKFFENYIFNGHQIGGYAYFTQVDPREYKAQFQDHKILLLQMDSYFEEDIMWGDVGVGNFFMREEDLKKLDFSNVLYNWDCT